MAKCNPTRASDFRAKRLRGILGFVGLFFVAFLFCSCIWNGGGNDTSPKDMPAQDTYHRPFTAMVQAVKTVLKRNRIQYTDDPTMEGVIDTDVMGSIEVKRLGSCETRVTLLQQASKSHPLQQTFFDELDRVLVGLPAVLPPPTPPPDDSPVAVFLPPKSMFIAVKGGGTGNIRSSARIERNVISKLPAGTPVSAYKRKGKWYHISFGENRKGWAHEVILKEGIPKPATLVRKPRPAPTRDVKREDAPVKNETSWEPITTLPKTEPPPDNIQSSKRVATTTAPRPSQAENNTPSEKIEPHQSPPESIAVSAKPVLRIWEKGQVDVLEKPNVFAQSKGTLPPGARVTHFKDVGSFYQIEYDGLKGFVYKDFCKILK